MRYCKEKSFEQHAKQNTAQEIVTFILLLILVWKQHPVMENAV